DAPYQVIGEQNGGVNTASQFGLHAYSPTSQAETKPLALMAVQFLNIASRKIISGSPFETTRRNESSREPSGLRWVAEIRVKPSGVTVSNKRASSCLSHKVSIAMSSCMNSEARSLPSASVRTKRLAATTFSVAGSWVENDSTLLFALLGILSSGI